MTNFSQKQLFIFDLDGTLNKSKMPIDDEMGKLITELLSFKKVAIISGGGWPQFETQLLRMLPVSFGNFSNLYLMPTSGTRLMVWRGSWVQQYSEHLSPKEKERVTTSLGESLRGGGYVQPTTIYGQLIEDRGSQITFSALGQNAPYEIKSTWDPTREKREKIADILRSKIPEFDVRIGGASSIDITRRGINKAYAIRKLEEYLAISADSIVFVGDSLFYGGNDYPAKATGVDCVSVADPEETKTFIRNLLA